MKLAALTGLLVLASTQAFAYDVYLKAGESAVLCVSGQSHIEPTEPSVSMKLNRILRQKNIQLPGETNGAVIYMITAPFSTSAPAVYKDQLCVTLTQQ